MPAVSILINDIPLTESYKDMAAWDPIYWQRFTGNKTQVINHNREFLWDVITHGLKSTAVCLNCHYNQGLVDIGMITYLYFKFDAGEDDFYIINKVHGITKIGNMGFRKLFSFLYYRPSWPWTLPPRHNRIGTLIWSELTFPFWYLI